MSKPCVVDTMVLRKANAALTKQPHQHRDFSRRLALLSRIQRSELQVLISEKLIHEYRQQIEEPRNDFVKSFFELLLDPAKSKPNYHKPWSGKERQAQHDCRFPPEDVHVLRTAVLTDHPSTIFSEEERMLKTDACIHRRFSVHVSDPIKEP